MPKSSKKPLEVRAMAGLQQWEMSSLLGVSREALAAHESTSRKGLPHTASLHHLMLYAEMIRPENQQAVTRETFSDAGKQKLQEHLRFVSKVNRFRAQQTQRQVDKCIEKQEQLHQRQLLLYCAEKVQTSLIDMSKPLPESFVSERQQQWLESRKSDGYFAGFDDALYIHQKKLELKCRALLSAAEEAERMLQEIGEG